MLKKLLSILVASIFLNSCQSGNYLILRELRKKYPCELSSFQELKNKIAQLHLGVTTKEEVMNTIGISFITEDQRIFTYYCGVADAARSSPNYYDYIILTFNDQDILIKKEYALLPNDEWKWE